MKYRIGYQGDWTDPRSGDVNMGARWYSPASGTFNSRETITYPAGVASARPNLYAYARTTASVREASPRIGSVPVYNLTVANTHTYYVLAGDTPVLVHNANCWSPAKKKSSTENAHDHWQKHKSEFPHLNNSKEYVEAAADFLNTANPNALTRSRSNFKPNPAEHGYPTNLDYFNAQ